MELQLQDVLEIFFISSSSEVEEAQTVPLTSEASVLADDPELPVLLFETSKFLFDLALENGFRALGAE